MEIAGLALGVVGTIVGVASLVLTWLTFRQTRRPRPWFIEKITDERWRLVYTGWGRARVSEAFVHGDWNPVTIRDGSGEIRTTQFRNGEGLLVFLDHASPGMSFNLAYRREWRHRYPRSVPPDRDSFEGHIFWQAILW